MTVVIAARKIYEVVTDDDTSYHSSHATIESIEYSGISDAGHIIVSFCDGTLVDLYKPFIKRVTYIQALDQ